METAFLKPYNTKNKNPCSLLADSATAGENSVDDFIRKLKSVPK